MGKYDCSKCYATTQSDEDLHLTEHIGCGGTWIWDDGFSMTEPQTTTHQKEYKEFTARIAALEAALREIAELAHEVPANIYTFRCQEIESKAKAALGK